MRINISALLLVKIDRMWGDIDAAKDESVDSTSAFKRDRFGSSNSRTNFPYDAATLSSSSSPSRELRKWLISCIFNDGTCSIVTRSPPARKTRRPDPFTKGKYPGISLMSSLLTRLTKMRNLGSERNKKSFSFGMDRSCTPRTLLSGACAWSIRMQCRFCKAPESRSMVARKPSPATHTLSLIARVERRTRGAGIVDTFCTLSPDCEERNASPFMALSDGCPSASVSNFPSFEFRAQITLQRSDIQLRVSSPCRSSSFQRKDAGIRTNEVGNKTVRCIRKKTNKSTSRLSVANIESSSFPLGTWCPCCRRLCANTRPRSCGVLSFTV
mmetsp:Transcript_33154/g.92901  ORF Transcript_33154/g.92901 Transcript_33154/m.92901 type:complete len:327 (-) Transcript_33154:909-1889(-)